MISSGQERALRLLALDGGGIRGLSELLIIKEVMHRLRKEESDRRRSHGQEPLKGLPKPCEYFDLIGGTSTGGIIALMLGRLRMDVEEAIDSYHRLAKNVFSQPKRRGGDGRFSATKLENAVKSVVKEELGDSDSLLLEHGDDVCRTFVCCKNAHNMNIPVLLRSYEVPEVPISCTIWQATRATSAAPTFFKRVLIGRDQPFIDGGMGVNNPASVLLQEAEALFPNRTIGCLVSIGTGQAKPAEIPRPRFFQRILPTDVIQALKKIATDCDGTHQVMYTRFANSETTYFRFNVDQGLQDVELSEWEKLDKVEAHTMQYMKDGPVKGLFVALVDRIVDPRGKLTAGQINMHTA